LADAEWRHQSSEIMDKGFFDHQAPEVHSVLQTLTGRKHDQRSATAESRGTSEQPGHPTQRLRESSQPLQRPRRVVRQVLAADLPARFVPSRDRRPPHGKQGAAFQSQIPCEGAQGFDVGDVPSACEKERGFGDFPLQEGEAFEEDLGLFFGDEAWKETRSLEFQAAGQTVPQRVAGVWGRRRRFHAEREPKAGVLMPSSFISRSSSGEVQWMAAAPSRLRRSKRDR
jgi:hypothetical protein